MIIIHIFKYKNKSFFYNSVIRMKRIINNASFSIPNEIFIRTDHNFFVFMVQINILPLIIFINYDIDIIDRSFIESFDIKVIINNQNDYYSRILSYQYIHASRFKFFDKTSDEIHRTSAKTNLFEVMIICKKFFLV